MIENKLTLDERFKKTLDEIDYKLEQFMWEDRLIQIRTFYKDSIDDIKEFVNWKVSTNDINEIDIEEYKILIELLKKDYHSRLKKEIDKKELFKRSEEVKI